MLRTSIQPNSSTKVRICQDRRRPKRSVDAPEELRCLPCTCRRYPAEITSVGGVPKVSYKPDWSKCPRHASINLWNIVSEYPATIPWFRLWEGTKGEYNKYYNSALRFIDDWLWLAQPYGRRALITPVHDAGGEKIEKAEVIELVKTAACCDVKGRRYGRPENKGGVVLNLCDNSLTILDLDKIRRYGEYKGITSEQVLIALFKDDGYEPDVEGIKLAGTVGANSGSSWDVRLAVPRIEVPPSLATWLVTKLPHDAERDEAANRIWWDVNNLTEDYRQIMKAYKHAQGEMPTSVLVTVDNYKEVIADYIDKERELSSEEIKLKQKICTVLGGYESSDLCQNKHPA